MTRLEASYAYCEQVARSRAKNFYYSFVLLSKQQRLAMCAIYAFMRRCDDLSDGVDSATPAVMNQWRRELDNALTGNYGDHPGWPAFHDTVERYRIPTQYFHEMIDGVSSDLQPRDIETFDELYRYCYQVASVVGLTVVHVFGFESPRALELAEKCGIAFQLTNIIRDVREDQEMGRSYLPREDRERYPDLRELLAFEAARARSYYEASAPLVKLVHPRSRASLWALIEIYRRLLRRIEGSGYDVLSQRIGLSPFQKVTIVTEALLRAPILALAR
ncbi:MAG TPA: phytoene/squalene synthase family protein [Bryobacteraceae bacterium]|nr:phytoene/squalene synthase family protein [Bryobacteraceae bacterium]